MTRRPPSLVIPRSRPFRDRGTLGSLHKEPPSGAQSLVLSPLARMTT